MTPELFRAHLDRLGYGDGKPGRSHAAFARVIRYNERTVRKWADGAEPVPYTIEMLLTGKKIPHAL